MSKMARELKQKQNKDKVLNFMNGISYKVNPMNTLRIISASSFFGEPSYYRGSKSSKSYVDQIFYSRYGEDFLFSKDVKNTEDLFIEAVDNALDYDFYGTISWAAELRKNYNMRLNPQVIMVRAAMHPKRQEFTKKYPGTFDAINSCVMSRADEPAMQIAYYIYATGDKNRMPAIMKRSLAKKLSSLNAYQVNKYKNAEIGMKNAIRIVHANSQVINDLMNDKLKVTENLETWEQMRSRGESWEYIFYHVNMGHMALLRNLRGAFSENHSAKLCKDWLNKLENTVIGGKQFPFRYFSAYKAVEQSDIPNKSLVLKSLEKCIDISLENMPKFKGSLIALTDNSGSAWGGRISEYGNVTIAEINNLSAVIAASRSDNGYVGVFGDTLKILPVYKKNILAQTAHINADQGHSVGLNTEGGIWEFFNNAILNNKKYDNILIFSDQQAGHGKLYGTRAQELNYSGNFAYFSSDSCYRRFIDVYKLIKTYRAKVNPKVNVLSIQTAGYDNMLVPEQAYRTSIFCGWNANFLNYLDMVTKEWDIVDENK